MEVLISLFIAAWLVASSIARTLERGDSNRKVTILKEERDKSWKELSDIVKEMRVHVLYTYNLTSKLFEEETMVPIGAKRIYAAILRSGEALRLHMLPAESVQDFKDKSMAILGKKWVADVVEYLDVTPEERVVERAPALAEKKEMNARQGLYFLQMTRDRVAKPSQKKTMESIISNYKQMYDLA